MYIHLYLLYVCPRISSLSSEHISNETVYGSLYVLGIIRRAAQQMIIGIDSDRSNSCDDAYSIFNA